METAESPRRSRSGSSSSPEFEFWMVRNRAEPTQGLHSADELFHDGVILPLDLLFITRSEPSGEQREPSDNLVVPPADPPPASILSSSSSQPATSSRRWKDLFKVAGEKKPDEKQKEKEKERRKERRGVGGTSADINITLNIWPFSRSRSAGTTSAAHVGRSRSSDSIAGRKVSSAPCSRSNSRGETTKPPATSSSAGLFSRTRRWAPSPGRGGVHLGRTSPVYQLRRAWAAPSDKSRRPNPAASTSSASGGPRVLNLNVNSCYGYRNQVSCRGDDSDGTHGCDCTTAGSPSDAGLLGLRTRLSKKVY